MKEFKSAHSRMFSRRGKLDDDPTDTRLSQKDTNNARRDTKCDQESRQPDSAACSSPTDHNNNNQQLDQTDACNQSASAAIKTLVTKRKLGHLLPPVARVAAAN